MWIRTTYDIYINGSQRVYKQNLTVKKISKEHSRDASLYVKYTIWRLDLLIKQYKKKYALIKNCWIINIKIEKNFKKGKSILNAKQDKSRITSPSNVTSSLQLAITKWLLKDEDRWTVPGLGMLGKKFYLLLIHTLLGKMKLCFIWPSAIYNEPDKTFLPITGPYAICPKIEIVAGAWR